MRDWVRKICQRSEKYVGKIELIGRGVLLKLYSAGSVDKGKKWRGEIIFCSSRKFHLLFALPAPLLPLDGVSSPPLPLAPAPPQTPQPRRLLNIIIMLLLSAAFLTYRRNARTCNFN